MKVTNAVIICYEAQQKGLFIITVCKSIKM